MVLLIVIILIAAIIIGLVLATIQNNKHEKQIQLRREKLDREAREFYQKHNSLD